MMSYPLLELCLLGSLWSVRGCMPPPGWNPEPWPMPKMLINAPYVVIATGVSAEERSMAKLNVTCVLSSPTSAANFPLQIYVENFVTQHSCLNNPQFILGRKYILALKKVTSFVSTSYPADLQFDNYEPEQMVPNIFEVTNMTIQTAFTTCKMDPQPTFEQHCPASPSADHANCLGMEFINPTPTPSGTMPTPSGPVPTTRRPVQTPSGSMPTIRPPVDTSRASVLHTSSLLMALVALLVAAFRQ